MMDERGDGVLSATGGPRGGGGAPDTFPARSILRQTHRRGAGDLLGTEGQSGDENV